MAALIMAAQLAPPVTDKHAEMRQDRYRIAMQRRFCRVNRNSDKGRR
jgi:hypothetical protein